MRKSVNISPSAGAPSENSSFTPISPTRKQRGFFTAFNINAARLPLGTELSSATQLKSTAASISGNAAPSVSAVRAQSGSAAGIFFVIHIAPSFHLYEKEGLSYVKKRGGFYAPRFHKDFGGFLCAAFS
jgi:hypothetical protein